MSRAGAKEPIMDAEDLLLLLDADAPTERTAGGCWIRPPVLDVRRMATLRREREVRLVTISARPDPTGDLMIIYHWDAGSTIVHAATTISGGQLPTIADIVPGADWAEREIRDHDAVEFGGRASTPPLMLRDGDPVGLFARTGDLARDVDPARAARACTEAAVAPGAPTPGAPAPGAPVEGAAR
jgi:Respiratory-chain NADH dehydrogenase, 30 Kd subunit